MRNKYFTTVFSCINLIGKSLINDHPVGIQYGGGPKTATSIPAVGSDYTSAMFNDADFRTAKSQLINGKPVWWVETTGSGVGRQKADMQLYTRSEAAYAGTTTSLLASNVEQPYVECASCHDPHNSTNATFLRIANTGSALCLACHDK